MILYQQAALKEFNNRSSICLKQFPKTKRSSRKEISFLLLKSHLADIYGETYNEEVYLHPLRR